MKNLNNELSLFPLLLVPLFSFLWHFENLQLPISDSVEYMDAAYSIFLFFEKGEYLNFLISIFNERGWRPIAFQIFIWLFFISGFWLWIVGRPSFHIGASGIVYALASFLFVSGMIRKNPRLAAVSLVITFLYGSMIWGIFPTKETVSWEAHLSGFVSGILVAIFYRHEGPKRKKYQWEIDEELEDQEGEEKKIKINYVLKDKPPNR